MTHLSYQTGYTLREYSSQLAHPDFICVQGILRSACASAQSDLSIPWAYIQSGRINESSLSAWRCIASLITHRVRRFWSDCVFGQADLNLRWQHLQPCRECRIMAQMPSLRQQGLRPLNRKYLMTYANSIVLQQAACASAQFNLCLQCSVT